MGKRGVKPGTKRNAYRKKTPEELAEAKAKRAVQADMVLDQYLEPTYRWTRDWKDTRILANVYLASFAGLSEARAARVLGVPDKELLEAFKQFPETKAHWDRGQEDIVLKCHMSLAKRIDGMTVTEIRRTEKGDGTVDVTTITKELPPCVDSIKFFLNNRVEQYQEINSTSQYESRLDTMLSRIEQLDLFDK